MNYPLTNDDFTEMAKRIIRKEPCTIPIRRDIVLTNGGIAPNCLTWGSGVCYQIVEEGGEYYGRPRD